MIKCTSIRHQTLVLLLGLTLGLTLVFTLLTLLVAFVVEDMLLDNWMAAQAHYAEHYFSQNGVLPNLPLEFMQLFISAERLPDSMQVVISQKPLVGEIFTPDETHYHYRQIDLGHGKGYLLAEVSTLLVVSKQPEIFSIFLIALFMALLAVTGLAVKFSRRIVDPVIALSNSVKNNEESGARLDLSQMPDELGYLGKKLQASFDKRDELLQQEQDFSTNVSHELRTPLTQLKNATALITQRGYKHGDLVVLNEVSGKMHHTVEVLFALARCESIQLTPCHLGRAVENAILQCRDWLNHFELNIQMPSNLVLLANPHLLELLIINLLRNANEHASEPVLYIEANEQELIFKNKADDYIVVDVNIPGTKSDLSKGLGQGLYLVKRIANRFSWDFCVEIDQQYFKAILRYPHSL